MIGIIFEFVGDFVEVRVEKNNILFRTNQTGFTTIDNLRLNEAGVIKEFPDLDGAEDWKAQAIERFKQKIQSYDTEDEKMDYIKEDLQKHGYNPIAMQKKGFRTVKLKSNK